MTVKRSIREVYDGEIPVENLAMANCALILSRADDKSSRSLMSQAFKCKTCARHFDSFQALGGHRGIHKRPKSFDQTQPHYSKKHQCSVCGLQFGTGQALGGHMRRHRGDAAVSGGDKIGAEENLVICDETEEQVVPVFNKSNNTSTKKEYLDLNLTPYENGLDLNLGW